MLTVSARASSPARIAASKVYHGDAYTDADAWNYYAPRKDDMMMHPETRALLEKLLLMLRDEGEFRTLAYMRYLLKKNAEY
jgi:hypothetical protein